MKTWYLWSILIALALVSPACGDREGGASGDKEGTSEKEAEGPFEEKQGMVEMTMEMMGMKPTMTLYFDDYGNRQATWTTMEMMGKKMENVTLIADGFSTNWDNTTKVGTKTKADGFSGGPMELIASLTPERRKSLNYKEIGARDVLGNKTTGFSIDSGGIKMSVWHWKGIPLQIEMDAKGMAMKITATKVDFEMAVPADRFTVPADVKISEGGTPAAGEGMAPPATEAPKNADTSGK